MKALLLALLMAPTRPADHPRTYLVSIVDFPLKAGESVESFSFQTWGVDFKAVCRVPSGWRIKVGASATPDGVLEGEGSQGATWFNRPSPKALEKLVLVTLYGPVQKYAEGANGELPATFSGKATLSTEDGEKEVALSTDNIRLTPATRCP